MNDWIKESWRCPECGAKSEVCEHLSAALPRDGGGHVTDPDDVPDSVINAFHAQVDEGVLEWSIVDCQLQRMESPIGAMIELLHERLESETARTKRRQRRRVSGSAWWVHLARRINRLEDGR